MQLFVEEGVDEQLAVLPVHSVVDADDAAFEIDVAVVTSTIQRQRLPSWSTKTDRTSRDAATGEDVIQVPAFALAFFIWPRLHGAYLARRVANGRALIRQWFPAQPLRCADS
jgi:hypothetical protein